MRTLLEALNESLSLMFALDHRLISIAVLTLRITLSSLVLSTIIGLPIGTMLGLAGRIPARGLIMALLYTGMGLPPVVVGLLVFVLLSRSGPLGYLAWLFSPNAMILAQTIIALPLIIGLTMAAKELEVLLKVTNYTTAMEILFEGRIFGADEALQKRLVNRVVNDKDVEKACCKKRKGTDSSSRSPWWNIFEKGEKCDHQYSENKKGCNLGEKDKQCIDNNGITANNINFFILSP